MPFTRNRIRLTLYVTTPFATVNGASAIQDFFLGSSPLIPHGRATQFEIALFQGTTLDAASGLDSLTLELKELVSGIIDTGAPELSQTVSSSEFNTELTQGEWEAGTEYYAVFEFTEADLNLDMTGATTEGAFTAKSFGLVISGQGPDGRVDLAAGVIKVLKSGATGLGSGAPPVPSYTFSDAELAAALAGRLKLGINAAGATFTLPATNNPTKGLLISVFDPGDGGECYIKTQQVVIPS